ncbi:MAG: DUF1552 domain-containing protein [Deltaproteobacteria bacterium]|nr:DUF1552 domain-containing protein [Deltaproteobacteria bacterium]
MTLTPPSARRPAAPRLTPAHPPLSSAPSGGPSRRALLRGAGAALALPWLESAGWLWARAGGASPLGRAHAQAPAAPRRFVALYSPNGFNMSAFWPARPGALSASALAATSLAPLAPFADALLTVRGLDNYAASHQGDGPGDHARGTSAFLTCAHPLKSADVLRSGPSVDQLLAAHLAGQTPLRSLELGCEGGDNAGSCDSGYSCAYSRNVSWADAQTPLPKEVNPRLLFERLFGVLDPNQSPEAVAERLRRRRSVLDFVVEDAAALRARVSASDARRVDAYLTGLRELEGRLASPADAGRCAPPSPPLAALSGREEHAGLLLDLLASALQCDLTRVGTFMLGNGGSGVTYPAIGVSEAHHELSHHQGDPHKLAQLAAIDARQMGLWAGFLARLAAMDEGAGSALQQTTVLMSSEVADGNAHEHTELPVALAGRAAGAPLGRHVVLAPGAGRGPIANLYIALMADLGLQVARFGDDGVAPLSL